MSEQDERLTGYPMFPAPIHATQLPSPELAGPSQDFEDSADLRDYLEVILRRKWLIFSILFVCFLTTLIISLTMQPLYRADGTIELSVQAPRVTKFEDMMSSQVQAREFIQTQMRLLQSDTLAARVIERLQLDSNPLFNPAAPREETGIFARVKKLLRSALSSGKSKGNESQGNSEQEFQQVKLKQRMLARFAASLQVKVERDTTLISISFSSPVPALSREVVNALIEEFIAWQVDKKIDSSITAKKQLEKQIDAARVQLEKAENNLNEFSRKAGIVSLSSNLNLIYSQLEEVNRAYVAVQTERISKETLYNQIKRGGTAFPAAMETPLVQKLRMDYNTLAAEYKEASVTYKDDYPKLQEISA